MQVKRQSNGTVISLSAPIASGGEGAIYEFPPDASLVAKVYHAHKLKDIDSDKLQLMLANPPDDSAKKHGFVSIAWPVDLLLSTSGSQQIIGFLMPRVPMQQVLPIHDYYSPGTRRQKTPYFNYQYLHQTARNFAAAMSALHAKGYVIGDVNESNILVSETAMVTLVDTDSFQVRDPGQNKVYRCPVGKPEYTPPELQGKKFGDHDRSPEHDLFGLGVLIFQLLMEGMHPFAGVYQGSGDPPPQEKRIVAGHFPYGNKKVPYQRPPNALPFDVLNSGLRDLFVRCFEDGHNNPKARPNARSWVKALEAADKDLVSCRVNPQHQYGGHLSSCPWCERKIQLLQGRDPFPARAGIQSNIPVQIPLPPASKPKPVSSPTPTPTYATPVRPTPIYNPPQTPTPTPKRTPIPTPTQPMILAGSIAIVTILGITYAYSQWQAYQTLNIAENFRDEKKYEACILQVSNINQHLRFLTSNFNQSSQALLHECQFGFDSYYEIIIKDAKSRAIKKQYEEAIQKASQISNKSSIYQESVKLIDVWSKNILEIATDKYQQGNLSEAIKIAKSIPIVPQNEVLRQNAQKDIQQWPTNWKKAENEFQKAQESFKNGQWQSVIDSYNTVSAISYWKNQLEPLIQVAGPQREAELKREKYKEIELAMFKGEMMVRDTSRVWEKFAVWRDRRYQYASTPAAWMYLEVGLRESSSKKWCWFVYIYSENDRIKNPRFIGFCDGNIENGQFYNGKLPDGYHPLSLGTYNQLTYSQTRQPIYNYSGEKTLICPLNQTDKKIHWCITRHPGGNGFTEPGLPIP